MATSYLPKAITKDVLFERAQERFQEWTKIYADPTKTAQWMYEDMSCSCYCGCPVDDFPDDVRDEQESIIRYQYKDGQESIIRYQYKDGQESIIRYQYKDGGCFFIVDGIEVEVLDLRSMRESPRVNKETYTDVCVPTISYTDDDGNYMYHIIPDTWIYGSTQAGFDEGKPVHKVFIDAAREYIKEHGITKEMQEVQD